MQFMFILMILLQRGVFAAEQPCPVTFECPSTTLESGEVVQLVMKDTFLEVPSMFNLSPGLSKGYRCSIPACSSNPCLNGATCEETDKGFKCTCLDGYQGEKCDDEGGDFLRVSSADYLHETVTVRCPSNVSNITDCWYDDTTVNERTASTGVVCCTSCCSNPCQHGATCEETDKGFKCTCLDGYRGETCEEVTFIHSLRLVNGSIGRKGKITVTSQSRPSTHKAIQQGIWPRNASQLVCQYLGFEGGDFFSVSSADYLSETVTVRCPANVRNITECWSDDTMVNERTESIGVVCCTSCCSYPCQHGATCEETDNGFKCTCSDGYRGERCEEDCPIIHTPDSGNKRNISYHGLNMTQGVTSFHFEVSANNDATIVLLQSFDENDLVYVLVIGKNNNGRGCLRRLKLESFKPLDYSTECYAEPSSLVLSGIPAYDHYQFSIEGTSINVRRYGSDVSLIDFHDSDPLSIKFVGIFTGWGSEGYWKFPTFCQH